MMPFLPLTGCRFKGVEFDGWLFNRRDSCVIMREGRQALLNCLNKHARIEHRDVSPHFARKPLDLNLQWIRDTLQYLGTTYEHDFRHHHSWSLLSGRYIPRGHLDATPVGAPAHVNRSEVRYVYQIVKGSIVSKTVTYVLVAMVALYHALSV